MSTIRQMYSGVFANYKTQFSNGQIFRSTPNATIQRKTSSWNSTNNILANRSLAATSTALSNLGLTNSRAVHESIQNSFNQEVDNALNTLKNSTAQNSKVGDYLKLYALSSLGSSFNLLF